MLYPAIDEMVNKVDSKYTLVVAAAKRARGLCEGSKVSVSSSKSHSQVGIALEEIYLGALQVKHLEAAEEAEQILA